MRIEQGEEQKEIDIPISEVVKDGGRLNILPNVKNYFSVDYKPKSDKLTLVAGNHIGLIPINESLAVEIKPKFPVSNLIRMVAIAEDNFNTLDFFKKYYRIADDSESVVLEFLAECLANELKTLENEGVLKEYYLKSEDTQKIRGRICFNSSINSLWSHGHLNKASIKYFDFTSDNPFNRLIKYTLYYCINELGIINSKRRRLKDLLIDFYSFFEEIPLDTSGSFLDFAKDAIRNDKISTLRSYYVNICEICRLILERTGINFDGEGGEIKLSSFTLDMGKIFEKYLRNSIRLHRHLFPENTSILDGNKEGRKKFYNQPSLGKGDAMPDIIFKNGERFGIIADAKYKRQSKDLDRYQVISHALSYGAQVAILLLPKNPNKQGNSLVKIGSVGCDYKIEVYEYYYDLSSSELSKEEKKLSEALLSLLPTSN